MMNVHSIFNNGISFSLDQELYSKTVVQKCLYWYCGTFDVSVNNAGNCFSIEMVSNEEQDWPGVISKIKQDLADFSLREIIVIETSTVRDLIIAKAFSYADTDMPTTPISDPVGFDPSLF